MRSGMFGEQLTPVASPWLLKSGAPLKKPADLTQFALIEAGDAHQTHLEWLTWRRWFDEHGFPKLQPKRWLYFNYAYQMVQAALTGQGVVLARCRWWRRAWPTATWSSRCPTSAWIRPWPTGSSSARAARSARRSRPSATGSWPRARPPARDHRRSAGPGHRRRSRLRLRVRRSARPRRCRSGSRPAARRAVRVRSLPGNRW